MTMQPFRPMSPISADTLPEGPDWAYQLKWDGYRLIACIEEGKVRLYSKNMLDLTGKFPDIVSACAGLPGTLILDGEAVVLDPATGKPSFQLMQQRNKPLDAVGIRRLTAKLPIQYIVFDLLRIGDEDLRRMPFRERDRRLKEAAACWNAPLHTTDSFSDGSLLWEWIVRNGWEGVVAKRLSSAYREGKEHRDWLKRKRRPEFDVDIVGVLWKEGRVSSLVMRENGVYFGRVSSGLNGALKENLSALGSPDRARCPFAKLPDGLRGERVHWLETPLGARVTGSEVTEEGSLRHPKLLMLGI